VLGSERRTCFETQCVMALQGHTRSLILALMESAHAISCWSSIVTLPRFRDIAGLLLRTTPPLFHLNFRGAFDWCQNQLPWMTPKGHYALFQNTCVFRSLHENLNEDSPTLSATKMQPNDSRFWQYKLYAEIRGGSEDLCKFCLDFMSAP